MNKKKVALLILLVIIIQSLPYLFAATAGGNEHIFSGFLINPVDGNSYLAKMREGWAGSWKFTLPYSPQGGDGAYLFLFYLFLGHVARIFSLPLIWVFHFIRVVSSVVLLVALAHFLGVIFKERNDLAWKAFLLSSISAGLGWLAALASGYLPGDFWIAEAFPFLSNYANPHFPLGLALILWIAVLDARQPSLTVRMLQILSGLLVSVIQPFGVVIAAIILAGNVVIRWTLDHTVQISSVLFTLLLGGPFLLYQYLAIQNDPVLAAWNLQNQTPAPPIWDLVLSLSPAFLLALVGIFGIWKEKDRFISLLAFWLIISVFLVYLPFNLQRRFMTGLFVPVAALAVFGADWLAQRSTRSWSWLFPAVLFLSLPTNILLMVSGAAGAAKLDPILYRTKAEEEAFTWIQEQTPQNAVLLAPERSGLLIPALTGRRVVYGHPFETIHADQERKFVADFFAGNLDEAAIKPALAARGVNFIFLETSEPPTILAPVANLGEKAYDREGIQIYQVTP